MTAVQMCHPAQKPKSSQLFFFINNTRHLLGLLGLPGSQVLGVALVAQVTAECSGGAPSSDHSRWTLTLAALCV